jgi:hypothetical protein
MECINFVHRFSVLQASLKADAEAKWKKLHTAGFKRKSGFAFSIRQKKGRGKKET